MDDKNFIDSYKDKLTSGNPDQQSDPADREKKTLHFEDKTDFVPTSSSGSAATVRRRPKWPLVAGAAFIVLAAALVVWLLTRGVAVVDLSGWPISDAQVWASDNGIRLQISESYNDDLAENLIISQEPQAGQSINKGGFLKVEVSLGHDLSVTLDLPDLLAMTMAEVENWAADNYMTKVRITTEYSSSVPSGQVISFEINDNTVVDQVKRSTPIYVIVSKGPEPEPAEQVTLPDFTTMMLNQAQQFADDNGLVLTTDEQYDDFSSAGTILSQSIAAGDLVASGTEIVLVVSKGKLILVPSFAGYSREQAMSLASSLGINASVVEQYSTRSAGSLVKQSIASGTAYEAGDILTLTYSLGNEIILGSFVGQTKGDILAWAKTLNDQGASITIKVTTTENNAPKDTIVYQSKTNTSIGIKTSIDVTVSLGKKVFVPDLVAPAGSGYDLAMTKTRATAVCEALGLIPVFVESAAENRLPGEVWSQSLAAGTEAYEGSTIVLKYDPVDKTIEMPDFRGMSRTEIIDADWLYKLDITFVELGYPVEGYSGTVCEQSREAGWTVAYGTAVTLGICEPAPTETSGTD